MFVVLYSRDRVKENIFLRKWDCLHMAISLHSCSHCNMPVFRLEGIPSGNNVFRRSHFEKSHPSLSKEV